MGIDIRKKLSSKWPAIGWTLMIFILLTVRTGSFERVPLFGVPHLDKFVHIILFGTLVFLWWAYVNGMPKEVSTNKVLLIIFLAASLFGIGMEFYQEHFTSREFELEDIYADIAGAALSSFFCSYLKNKPLWK